MENNVPKDTQSVIDEAFDKLTGEQPQESTPVTEQVEPQKEDGSDPVKTPSTPETADKGFASHPAWIERENKFKEAKELLKQRDSEREQYSKLLDDPDVYAKWLKQQGFSDAHIRQALAEKGYQTPQTKVDAEKSSEAMAVAERVCTKLGWDINRLTPEQKAYVQDSVSLNMAVIEDRVSAILDKRLAPFEQASQEMSQQRQFITEESEVQKLAESEFPGMGFEDVIKPAIQKFLNELDAKDPQRTIKLSYEDIYYRATRPLLREITESKGRQEVRNTNKQNARPLGTGTATRTGEPTPKGRTPREDVEALLDAKGIR